MSGLEQRDLTRVAPKAIVSRSSFYRALSILPREKREATYEVYAFCRAVDDIADDGGPNDDRIAMLNHWREDIARLYAGGGPSELTEGLARPVQAFGLRQEDFLAIIDGMEMDVRHETLAQDWAMLELYCDRVASAVGRLSVRIFGIEGEKGRQLSHHLGRALQMTNILRDLDEDAGLGRLYLPREALAEAGIDEVDIRKVLAHPGLGQACASVVTRAKQHFAEASAVMTSCRRESVRSPRVMASVYQALLDKLVTRGWTPPRAEVHASKLQFFWAVVRHGII
jgi:presqualene diphosphate synthase